MHLESETIRTSISGLRPQVVKGLLYVRCGLNANTSTTLDAAASVYAMIELLTECTRIGLDFSTAIPNPALERLGWTYWSSTKSTEGMRTP